MIRHPAAIAVAGLALAATLSFPAPAPAAEELVYAGSNTLAVSILFDGALKAFERRTGLLFDRFELAGGTSEGLRKLKEGKVTVVGSSRRLKPEEIREGLVETAIGRDVNALWVNVANPVSQVTSAQAAALLGGTARNWKEAGGLDEPVKLVFAPEGSYSNCQETIRQTLLKDKPLGKADTLVSTPHDRLVEVALRKGGLTTISESGADIQLEPGMRAEVKSLAIDGATPSRENVISGSYPLVRHLSLVTRGEPKGKVKQFVDFMLSPEGQAIVAREAIPIR